jgi:uncharacterized damage-inducible protein DinB
VYLALLDEAYERKSWHGTNLRGSIRGLDAAAANTRSRPPGHSIAEIVVHCAYWKYTIWRKIRGEKRGSFPLKGSNWFPVADAGQDAAWARIVALLAEQHHALRSAVAELDAAALRHTPAGSKHSMEFLLRGVAFHDIYHAGQIQVLKAHWRRGVA